jgi:hypothetical protein
MKQNAATTNGIRFKKVPYQILMATNNIKQAFLQGWYDGDGAKTEGNSRRFDIKGQIGAAGLFHIASAIGYKVSVNTRTDKEEIYRLTLTRGSQRIDPDKIKKIIPLGLSLEDVFDIETENHHFGAGIGRMIVHNSVMVHLPHIKDSKECNYWGLRLAQEISGIKPGEKDCDGKTWPEGRPGLFPPPLAMEFEKAMRLLCLKKKKYAALLIGKDGTFKMEDIMDKHGNVIGNRLAMLKKGIILARRDNCAFLRETYTKILELIMNRGSFASAIDILVDSIKDLLNGKVPYEKLVSIRELGANYKSDSFFMKVFSDELKKAGKIVNPGDRLDFLIVEDPTATLLGHKMRLAEQYLDRLKSPNPERIDYNYYIEKSLMNPINQLFEVGFKDVIAQLQHFSYRPTNRHKQIFLDRPVQIILKMIERGYDLEEFRKAIYHNVAQLNQPKPIVLNIVSTESCHVKPLSLNIVQNKPKTPPAQRVPSTPCLIMPNLANRTSTTDNTRSPPRISPYSVNRTSTCDSMRSPTLILPTLAVQKTPPTLTPPRLSTPLSLSAPRELSLNITAPKRTQAVSIINGNVMHISQIALNNQTITIHESINHS